MKKHRTLPIITAIAKEFKEFLANPTIRNLTSYDIERLLEKDYPELYRLYTTPTEESS